MYLPDLCFVSHERISQGVISGFKSCENVVSGGIGMNTGKSSLNKHSGAREWFATNVGNFSAEALACHMIGK